jgi:hypothetical protein
MTTLFFCIFYFFLFQNPKSETVSLQDAVKAQKVSFKLEYQLEGTHYRHPLKIIVKNLGNQPLSIKLEHGQLINPNDSAYQTLITIQDIVMDLKPYASSTYQIAAMCTEPNDRGPDERVQYLGFSKSGDKLTALTQFLNDTKYENYQVQNAVWVISAGRELATVNGFEKNCRDSLLDVLCKITNKPRPSDQEMNSYIYNPSSNEYKVKVSGRINFSLYKSAKLVVGLYNTQRVQVRALVQQTIENIGAQSINYAFDNSVYTDKEYIVKAFVNDKLLFEKRHKMSIQH